jgi:hypothetical protein
MPNGKDLAKIFLIQPEIQKFEGPNGPFLGTTFLIHPSRQLYKA